MIFVMRFLLLTIAISPICLFAQKLSLSGTISGLQDATEVSLTDLQNGKGGYLDQTKAKNGSFTLHATLEEPSLLALLIGDSLKTALFMGNEKVTVKGAVAQPIDDWEYTGSKLQNDFSSFQKTFIPQFQKIDRIVQQLQMGLTTDSLRVALDTEINRVQSNVDRFIVAHPASPVSAMAILSTIHLTEDAGLLEKRLNLLQPAALANALGGHLKQAVVDARFLSIGSLALEFSQADTEGKPVSLSQFRGKYLLIDFWASWCGPCRKENVNLVKTFNKYKDKNFTVLGVSLDEDKNKWLAAIKKDELNWTQVSDLKGWENEVAQRYRITAIPRNLLLDPAGKIIAKDLRGDDLDDKLEQVLRNL